MQHPHIHPHIHHPREAKWRAQIIHHHIFGRHEERNKKMHIITCTTMNLFVSRGVWCDTCWYMLLTMTIKWVILCNRIFNLCQKGKKIKWVTPCKSYYMQKKKGILLPPQLGEIMVKRTKMKSPTSWNHSFFGQMSKSINEMLFGLNIFHGDFYCYNIEY